MANLPEEAAWVEGIYQLETSDPVLAGPGGIDNRQATELGNRTAYLKQGLEALASALAEQGEDSDPFEQYLLRAAVAADAGPLAWLGIAAGTANALTFNLPVDSAVASYKAGQRFQFKVGVANTGAVTAKIGTLAVKSILKSGSTGLVELAAGDLKPDVMYDLRFDGTQFQLGGGAGASDASIPLFMPQWWPNRASIPSGYAPADGQLLSRATFPDAWAGIQAGNVPAVADATWLSTATERGKYTAGDGATSFRLPDYNGKSAGSLGAVFMRGDGARSAVAGVIQGDAIRNITGAVRPYDGGTLPDGIDTGAFELISGGGLVPTGSAGTRSYYRFDASRVVPTASENRPLNVAGCWIIKVFGSVTNPGSADAAQLATDMAALIARVTALESRQRPLGDGQTVRDMTSQRALNVTYTNSSGRTIFVIAGTITGGNSYFNVGTVRMQYGGGSSGGVGEQLCSFPVPDGATYMIEGGAIKKWLEVRA